MKCLLAVLLLAASASAQPPALTFYIHDTTGVSADTPLPPIYQLNSTAQGSNSPLVVKAVNTSDNTIYATAAYVSSAADSAHLNPNFSLTGLFQGLAIPPDGSVVFTVNFAPLATGPITGYLQFAYQRQQSGCSFNSTDPLTACPSSTLTVSTLTGLATPPILVLSYATPGGSVVPQGNSSISFGNVSTSATFSITFTLANQVAFSAPTPAISLRVPQFGTPAFQLNTTQPGGGAFPASLAGNASATFVVTFAPGQTGLTPATFLDVGTNSYTLTGAGIIVADIDALQIAYVDATGIRTLPQAASPIQFGQLLAGGGATAALNFTVTNPTISFNAVTLPNLTVTGAGFGISGAPTLPASIAPGQAITFRLLFAPTTAGTFTGALSIGSRQFVLRGQSILSPLPALSMRVTPTSLTSQQQANVVLGLASTSPFTALGTLTMAFTPAVANVTDDSAVLFTSTNGRNLSVSFPVGSQTAVDNKAQSPFIFQTGTTAGAIALTATFVNTTPYTQSFTIPPAAVQITSGSALRQSPNLVVTLNGYDNTYSAGQLSFTFYDVSGSLIQPPIQYSASSQFHQYFFTNNKNGGAFSLQAIFPVTGDVTKIGSVAITLTNSAGQTTVTQTFK